MKRHNERQNIRTSKDVRVNLFLKGGSVWLLSFFEISCTNISPLKFVMGTDFLWKRVIKNSAHRQFFFFFSSSPTDGNPKTFSSTDELASCQPFAAHYLQCDTRKHALLQICFPTRGFGRYHLNELSGWSIRQYPYPWSNSSIDIWSLPKIAANSSLWNIWKIWTNAPPIDTGKGCGTLSRYVL